MGLAPERSKQKTGKILTEMSDLSSRQKQCEQKNLFKIRYIATPDRKQCLIKARPETMFNQD